MLNINKDDKSIPQKIYLSGVIDESAFLSPLLEGKPSDLFLFLQNVSRINSVGVKIWREFFAQFRKAGGKLNFFEIAPALVSAANYLSDFILPEEVRSLCIPFFCENCGRSVTKVYEFYELKKLNFDVTPPTCGECGCKTEIDEVPEEYFSFLSR
jgi:hypothetical protein